MRPVYGLDQVGRRVFRRFPTGAASRSDCGDVGHGRWGGGVLWAVAATGCPPRDFGTTILLTIVLATPLPTNSRSLN